MNHPQWVGVPLLMLADYALTVVGVRWAGVYRQHFVSPTYELNPRWREAVAQQRWFYPPYLLRVGLITLLLLLLDRWAPAGLFAWLLGVVFGMLGALISRHLGNLLLFRYLHRHPDEVAGQVHLSLPLLMKMSQFNYAGLWFLLALLAGLAPSPYTVGSALGVLGLILAHRRWIS